MSESPLPQRCCVCRSDRLLERLTLYDDRYGFPGRFNSSVCELCGHRSLQADFTPAQIARLYSDFYPRRAFELRSFCVPKEEAAFKTWLDGLRSEPFRWVPPGMKVLDIGCGLGESLAYLKSIGCDAEGVDSDENVSRVASEFGLNIRTGFFDSSNYPEAHFDYVTLGQVVEHFADPHSLFDGVSKVLKVGGSVILSTPNCAGWGARVFGRKWVHWHAPYHLSFYTIASMRACAEAVGLEILHHSTITSSHWLRFQLLHLLTFPEAGSPSVFWSGNGKLSPSKRAIRFLISAACDSKLGHFVTRFFDSIGQGDNSIYVLRKTS